MKILSNIKKVGYAGLILVMATIISPIFVSDTASAAACPSNARELTRAIEQRETDITLCANINNGVFSADSNRTYNFTLNLNGKTLANNGTVIRIQPNSNLTITGDGIVSGAINASQNRLTIAGGTYTVDPTRYIKDSNLKAYKDGNIWHVETKKELTVSPENITMRVGETSSITATGVTTPITYTSNATDIVSVESDGTVTAVATGTTSIKVSTAIYDESLEKTVNVSVYDIQAGEKDDEAIAADTVKDVIDNEGLPEDMTTASDKVKETFGADYVATGDNLKNAMNSGTVVTTNVNINDSTDTDAIAMIEQALKGINVTDVKYYDITVDMETENGLVGSLKKLDSKLTIVLAEVESPATGYERQYYVVAYHEGDDTATILTEGTDYIIKDGKIYLISDRFSTFAVAYEDTLIEEETTIITAKATKNAKTPNAGIVTNESKDAVKSSFISPVLALSVLIVISAVGVIRFAKKR